MIATDDWVDLAIRGQSRQIDSIFRQGVETLLGIFGIDPSVSANLVDGCFESSFGESGLLYNGLNAGVFDKGEEEMVLSNV